MGQTLSEPVTAKQTTVCSNNKFKVASSCMQGWRINMEDAHTHILSLPGDSDACFFAVYDGHGGDKVAVYAANNLHKRIVTHQNYIDGNVEEAIIDSFLLLDQDMLNDDDIKDDLAGATANVIIVKNKKIYCGNAGDSRSVASQRGRVIELSHDHKPSNELEAKRIIEAGGYVEFNRVNGNLALSRALGDFIFKKNDKKLAEEQMVSARPDVVVKDLTEDVEFILMACDGIWDVLTSEEVVDFVRARIAQRMDPDIICEELMTRCLAPDCQMGGLGCDNMTVLLVCCLHDGDYSQLADKCSRPRDPCTSSHAQDSPSHILPSPL